MIDYLPTKPGGHDRVPVINVAVRLWSFNRPGNKKVIT